ncbi:serine/threonine-protein kinase [Novipirellula sp.]|uniref:serine/threonine-protein kinase n=1 Tax=Novipirellula sp. TaxID=2795430 RepID=UPI0035655ED4
MQETDEPEPDAISQCEDISQLDEAFQLLAPGATPEELEAVAGMISTIALESESDEQTGDAAGLLLRLAKHFSTTDSVPVAAADGHAIPTKVGRFDVVREIGSGGFGVVYLARDEIIGREVAIKLPRRDLSRDTARRQQMLHEARAAGLLEHPGIIPIYETGWDGETVYIVSSYCNGPDLTTWQGLQTRLPTAVEAASFVSKLTNAVAYAHSQGVVHRDIKPSNVLLSRAGGESKTDRPTEPGAAIQSLPLSGYQPRLTDFGLAKVADEPLNDSRTSQIVGTPLYMAPEQLLPDLGPVTVRTDIYSLGVLLLELLTGKPLLLGKTYIEILSIFSMESRVIERMVATNFPRDLRQIILKCLSRTPADRFISAIALAEDLEAFVDGRPVSARTPTLVARVTTWCRDPRRTREACVFTLAAMIYMSIWVVYSIGLLWGPSSPVESPWTPTLQALGILATVNAPIAIFGFLGLGRRIWAMITAAIILIIGSIFVPALIIADVIGLLDPIYGHYPYFKKSFHSLVMLIGVAQLVYLTIGIYADHWRTKLMTADIEPN